MYYRNEKNSRNRCKVTRCRPHIGQRLLVIALLIATTTVVGQEVSPCPRLPYMIAATNQRPDDFQDGVKREDFESVVAALLFSVCAGVVGLLIIVGLVLMASNMTTERGPSSESTNHMNVHTPDPFFPSISQLIDDLSKQPEDTDRTRAYACHPRCVPDPFFPDIGRLLSELLDERTGEKGEDGKEKIVSGASPGA